MVMVLFIISMLAVLGATAMIMALYSLMNAQGLMASGKAFDAAESGISAAHAELSRELVPVSGKTIPEDPDDPRLDANPYFIATIENSDPLNGSKDWTITSTGTYTNDDGTTFTRKLEEKVAFAGTDKYFDALNYVLFSESGTIYLDSGGLLGYTDFKVNGNVYGRNLDFLNEKLILGFGVGLQINGNVYARDYCHLRAFSGIAASSAVRVTGGSSFDSAQFEALGEGVFAGGEIDLDAETWLLASSYITIDGNCIAGGDLDTADIDNPISIFGIKLGGYLTILGTRSEYQGSSIVPEVVLPEPDWDWYRAQAKIQDVWAEDNGYSEKHYFSSDDSAQYWNSSNGGTATPDPIEINESTQALFNGWICFSEGNLLIDSTDLKANTKGVFVALGDVTINSGWWMEENCEYQVIAQGKVRFSSGIDWNLSPMDTLFIYSGYNGSDYAVDYPLQFFKDILGQITAKGSIMLRDADLSLWTGTGITYRRPSVPVAGFPIPFQVKSWKVIQ